MKRNLKDTLCQDRERLHNVKLNFDCSYCNMVSALSMQTTRARNDSLFSLFNSREEKRKMNLKRRSFDPAGA